jgi:hypothetical protein
MSVTWSSHRLAYLTVDPGHSPLSHVPVVRGEGAAMRGRMWRYGLTSFDRRSRLSHTTACAK